VNLSVRRPKPYQECLPYGRHSRYAVPWRHPAGFVVHRDFREVRLLTGDEEREHVCLEDHQDGHHEDQPDGPLQYQA
jgi:hypothetical protein